MQDKDLLMSVPRPPASAQPGSTPRPPPGAHLYVDPSHSRTSPLTRPPPLTPTQLTALLKLTEQETRRTKQHVTIDLDLMQYDGERYHLADWERPYIQRLL